MRTIERSTMTAGTEGTVLGRPRLVLRLEGAVLLLAAALGYAHTGQSWWLAVLVLFTPDLLMVGYAAGPRAGALAYNLAHSYPAPAALGAVALSTDSAVLQALSVVWFAHIGLDRALGYGLKYDDGFAHTHLGCIGRHGVRPSAAGEQRDGQQALGEPAV